MGLFGFHCPHFLRRRASAPSSSPSSPAAPAKPSLLKRMCSRIFLNKPAAVPQHPAPCQLTATFELAPAVRPTSSSSSNPTSSARPNSTPKPALSPKPKLLCNSNLSPTAPSDPTPNFLPKRTLHRRPIPIFDSPDHNPRPKSLGHSYLLSHSNQHSAPPPALTSYSRNLPHPHFLSQIPLTPPTPRKTSSIYSGADHQDAIEAETAAERHQYSLARRCMGTAKQKALRAQLSKDPRILMSAEDWARWHQQSLRATNPFTTPHSNSSWQTLVYQPLSENSPEPCNDDFSLTRQIWAEMRIAGYDTKRVKEVTDSWCPCDCEAYLDARGWRGLVKADVEYEARRRRERELRDEQVRMESILAGRRVMAEQRAREYLEKIEACRVGRGLVFSH